MLSLNLIVRAVIIHEGKFLVSLLDDEKRTPFHTFLGGHVRLGETLLTTARREVHEEVGLSVQPVKLLYIVENFFFRGANKLHEIGYYFLCQPEDTAVTDFLAALTPNVDEQIQPVLLSPEELLAADFQPELLKQTLVSDINDGFAACPRAVVCNELPADVDAGSGVFSL